MDGQDLLATHKKYLLLLVRSNNMFEPCLRPPRGLTEALSALEDHNPSVCGVECNVPTVSECDRPHTVRSCDLFRPCRSSVLILMCGHPSELEAAVDGRTQQVIQLHAETSHTCECGRHTVIHQPRSCQA